MSAPNGKARYVRAFASGRALPEVEVDVLRAVLGGTRVLIGVAGLSFPNAEPDSLSASVAAWADGLSREHGLEWRRVGRDVLFTAMNG